MLPANDNHNPANLQVAVWKMVHAGVPTQVIIATLGLTSNEVANLQAAVESTRWL